MFPSGDYLPPQHTDDSVKPLFIVWQQLVSISTPHLRKCQKTSRTPHTSWYWGHTISSMLYRFNYHSPKHKNIFIFGPQVPQVIFTKKIVLPAWNKPKYQDFKISHTSHDTIIESKSHTLHVLWHNQLGMGSVEVQRHIHCEEMYVIYVIMCASWHHTSVILSSYVLHTCILLNPLCPCRKSFWMLLNLNKAWHWFMP